MEDEAKHNIDKLIDNLNNLKFATRLEFCPYVDQILDSIVNISKTSIKETTKVVIDKALLKMLGHKSKQNVVKIAEAIAEITMTRMERKQCTTKELIRAVIDLLKEDDIDILTPACLALENICQNENGTNLVREHDGLKVILTVLKKQIALHNVEGASVLRIKAIEFLCKFLANQEELFTSGKGEVPWSQRTAQQ